MANNKITINRLNSILALDPLDELAIYDVSQHTTNKVTISTILSDKLDAKAILLNNVNLNTQTTAGFYYCTNCTNIPSAGGVTIASNGYLWVFENNNGAIRQVWKDQIKSDSVGYNEFEREYAESTWTNWKRLAAKSVQIPNAVATATRASSNNVEDALSALANNLSNIFCYGTSYSSALSLRKSIEITEGNLTLLGNIVTIVFLNGDRSIHPHIFINDTSYPVFYKGKNASLTGDNAEIDFPTLQENQVVTFIFSNGRFNTISII